MHSTKLTVVGWLIILLGVACLLAGALVTPALVREYLSPDHQITPDGIKIIEENRRFTLSWGGGLTLLGLLLVVSHNGSLEYLRRPSTLRIMLIVTTFYFSGSFLAMIQSSVAIVNALLVSLTWILGFVLIVGIGDLGSRIVSYPRGPSLSEGFWWGFACTLVILQLWHLFAPVNISGALLIAGLGVGGLVTRYTRDIPSHPFQDFQVRKEPLGILKLVCATTFAIWLANRAMAPNPHYDAGLYHLPTMRWLKTSRIVAGLGNLHGRLAFNSSYFLFLSLFSLGPWDHHAPQIGSGVLLFVTSLQLADYAFKLFRRKTLRRYEALGILLLTPTVTYYFTHTAGTSPDLPVFLIGALVGIRLFKAIFHSRGLFQLSHDAAFILILSAVGVSVKLSFLVLAAASSIAVTIRLLPFCTKRRETRNLPNLTGVYLLAGLLLIPWVLRSFLLSGYAAYPSTILSIAVPWRLPHTEVLEEARWIASWARQPHKKPSAVLGTWSWIIPWLKSNIPRPLNWIRIILPLLLSCLYVVSRWGCQLHRAAHLRVRNVLLTLGPSVASLVFWFWTAPAPRFAGAAFWLLGAGTVLLIAAPQQELEEIQQITTISLLLTVIVFVSQIAATGLYVSPDPSEGFHPPPLIDTKQFHTDSGLVLHVPASTDQCWHAPSPCTPYPDPRLDLTQWHGLLAFVDVKN